ncbi:hypothetical protein J4480_06970 [Candidatus Woesearchaeota archaeon]|nr:hypothetical protein [Candidatus Woesearchaeota archaeon]
MGKITALLILITILMLSMGIAHAASFDVSIVSVKDKIVVDEIAEFDVVIQNNLGTDEDFTVKKAGYPFWDMYTKPLQNPISLKVPALGSASIRLFVDPLYITSVDTYTLDMGVVMERTGQEQKVPITIGIKSTEPLIGGYIPTVLASISISPEKFDPRKEFTIKILLNNQNPINYTNLTIKIESNLFKDEIHTPLGPREEKTIEIAKNLDGMASPQKDRAVIAIFKDDRMIVNPIVKEFEVEEYSTQENLPKEQSFLKIRRGVRVSSNNPDYSGTIKIGTTLIKNLFMTTYPKAELVSENEQHYLIWQAKPGEDKAMTVYTTENYRPIVVIIVLAIAAILLYFLFRSPLVVRKSIANIGMSEGGISDAKVVVRVKNRSPSQISSIEVMDSLPHIVHIERDLSIGSMQPHAVLKHPKGGLVIKWNIEAIEPGDERVLSYRMRSRLPILGELSLPAASARCKIGEKVIISNSNRVSVGR